MGRGWSFKYRISGFGNADVSIDKCPKCGEEGYAHKKWVWDGGHASGRYYIYYKHAHNLLHYGRKLSDDIPKDDRNPTIVFFNN